MVIEVRIDCLWERGGGGSRRVCVKPAYGAGPSSSSGLVVSKTRKFTL